MGRFPDPFRHFSPIICSDVNPLPWAASLGCQIRQAGREPVPLRRGVQQSIDQTNFGFGPSGRVTPRCDEFDFMESPPRRGHSALLPMTIEAYSQMTDGFLRPVINAAHLRDCQDIDRYARKPRHMLSRAGKFFSRAGNILEMAGSHRLWWRCRIKRILRIKRTLRFKL